MLTILFSTLVGIGIGKWAFKSVIRRTVNPVLAIKAGAGSGVVTAVITYLVL